MKKIILLLLFSLIASTISAQEAELPPPPDEIATQLDSFLSQIVDGLTSGETVVPGAPGGALLVRTPDWQYLNAAGTTTLAGDTPVTPDMAFQIGSNTKMMTATIILQLYEEGLLDIEAPMSAVLPEMATRIPNGEDVTIRHLLSHRSGIWDYVDGDPGMENGLFYVALGNPDLFARDYTPEELIDFAIENGQPNFAPGSTDENGDPNFAYCNTGYVLLGMIIEAITGESVEDVFAARIFEPLSMADTFFETGIAPEGTTPRGYMADMDTTDFNLSMAWTAGAVISTPADMAIFITALLNGELYADPATLDLMQSDPKLFAPTGGNYALGLQDKSYGSGLWGHGGQTLAFESDVVFDVNGQMAIVAWGSSVSNPAGFVGSTIYSALSTVTAPQPTIDDITGTELTLTQFYDPAVGMNQDIPGEGTYTITFNADGQMAIQADCNQVMASYAIDDQQALTIELGPSTMAACGPDSFADTFLAYLGNASTLIIISDAEAITVLILTVDNGSLSFTAPSG